VKGRIKGKISYEEGGRRKKGRTAHLGEALAELDGSVGLAASLTSKTSGDVAE
jgi:hypothetical protein